MRISEDRYTRDLRRLHLARRFIQHEVRTGWICAWTGLTGNRVRKLFRSYLGGVRRHRGPSYQRASSVLASPGLRDEASAASGLAYALGAVGDDASTSHGKSARLLERGERLCDAFDLYRELMPDAHLTLDQLIILTNALSEGEDVEIGHCTKCHGTLIVDRLSTGRRVCFACSEHRHRRSKSGAVPLLVKGLTPGPAFDPPGVQLPLDL